MADDSTVKKVMLTGTAAESMAPASYDGGGAATKSRKRSKKFAPTSPTIQKVGGGSSSPGTLDQLASTHVPGVATIPVTGVASNLTAKAPFIGLTAPSSLAQGGAQRVILSKSRKSSSAKVVLGAPKPVSTIVVPSSKRKKTAKKVRVNIGKISHRLRHAKTIRNKVLHQTMDDIKKELIKAGLIKSESKAPEPILRQMYSDFMVLKKRAL